MSRCHFVSVVVATFAPACLLVIDEVEEPTPVAGDASTCASLTPSALLELRSTLPFERATQNFLGQRRFVISDGRAFLATPDGRLIAVDLRDPVQPAIDERWQGPQASRLIRLAVDDQRLLAIAEGIADRTIELVDLGESPTDPIESWSLGSGLGSGIHLSTALGCVFAGSTFSDTFLYSGDRQSPPEVVAGLGGRLALAPTGLGVRSLDIVRVIDDDSCRIESVELLTSDGKLAAAERDRLWFATATAFSTRAIDASETTIQVDRAIADLALMNDLVIVAADRDVLLYRRQAPNVRPTPFRTIELTGRALAVAPVFGEQSSWLAVLMADESIENDAAFMSIVTFDLEDICP